MSTIQSVQRHRKCRAGLWDRQTGRYVVDRDVSRWWRPADLWAPLYLPSGKISSEPASAGTLRWRHSSDEHSSSSGPLRRAVNSWMKTPKRVIAVCPRGMRLTSLWWKEDKSERRGKHCVAVRTPSLTSPHLTCIDISFFPCLPLAALDTRLLVDRQANGGSYFIPWRLMGSLKRRWMKPHASTYDPDNVIRRAVLSTTTSATFKHCGFVIRDADSSFTWF